MGRTARRAIAAAALALLTLAPSAVAKGPHAMLSPGPAGAEPGQPWVARLTLLEFGGGQALAARPRLILRSGRTRLSVVPTRVGARVSRHADVLAELRYRVRAVFPHAGRWSYTVLDGTRANRRFRFPAVVVGGDSPQAPREVVAFAGQDPALSEPLAPQVFVASEDEPSGGRALLWVPAAGAGLAAAGALALLRRRPRGGGARGSGGS